MSALQLLLGVADELDNLALSPYYNSGDFGLTLNPHQIHRYQRPSICRLPLSVFDRMGDRRLMHQSKGRKDTAVANVGKDGFQVCMDVQQFKPSELSVKVVDNAVVVEGKHEEREDDHGHISRHFVRRYALPKNYDSEKVISTLSSDGVLTISIPKPAVEENPKEKIIQIQQTGPAHLNVKENKQEQSAQNEAAAGKLQNGNK